jgi:hypothetical protein
MRLCRRLLRPRMMEVLHAHGVWDIRFGTSVQLLVFHL